MPELPLYVPAIAVAAVLSIIATTFVVFVRQDRKYEQEWLSRPALSSRRSGRGRTSRKE